MIDRFLSMFTDFYRVLPRFTKFHRVLPSFTEFGFFLSYWRRLWPMFCPNISYNSVIDRFLSMFTGFYRVLPGFTEFYRVWFLLVLLEEALANVLSDHFI